MNKRVIKWVNSRAKRRAHGVSKAKVFQMTTTALRVDSVKR